MIDPRLLNKRWRLEHLYKIVDKDGSIVNFRLNEEQSKLFDLYESHPIDSEYGRRVQILKARQIGFTTFHCIYNLDQVVWNRGRTAAIIAHEREALEKIFRKVKFAYESMPEFCKPSASMENKRELLFDEINSNIYIALKVRSGTVHDLHVSEMAYIQNLQELKAGSFQSVPKTGNITIETTGNGFNAFYKDWVNAKGSKMWTNTFFPWNTHSEYRSKTNIESDLYDDYLKECTQEQKNWFYIKLDELGGDIDLMKQEYPLIEDDAFMATGKGVFDSVINKISPLTPIVPNKELYTGILDTDWDYVTIYKEPAKDIQYRGGADPSGGFSNGDPACFYILDAKTREICLEFHGTIMPDLLGRHIQRWGAAYNNAFIGIEVNNHGLSTINEIKEDYPYLYQRERRDTVSNTMKKEIGWYTSTQSKEELIDLSKKFIRESDNISLPTELITELRTFVRKDNGSMSAEDGATDDRVMAYMISLMMCASIPYYETEFKSADFMGHQPNYNPRKFTNKKRVLKNDRSN